MCITCWKKYGSHNHMNEKISAVLPLIERVYEHSGSGGGLHTVLDDWNIGDSHVEYCCHHHIKGCDTQEQYNDELACINALADMPIEDRNSALYHSDIWS